MSVFGETFDSTLSDRVLASVDPDNNFISEILDSVRSNEISQYVTIDQFNDSYQGSNLFSIFNLNIRSFFANEDKFSAFMSSLTVEPSVLVLTETWLTEVNRNYCNLDGYSAFHTIRSGGRRSGGVSIFIKEGISCKLVSEFCFSNIILESCVVELIFNKKIFVIFSVYKACDSPTEQFNRFISETLNNEFFKNKNIVVLGDMNINLLNLEDAGVREFVCTMQSLKFLPCLTKPTRSPNFTQNSSLIDHIWINTLDHYQSGIFTYELTDHLPTFLCLPIITRENSNSKIKIVFRNHSTYFINKFVTRLRNFDWSGVFLERSVNLKWSKFSSTLNFLYTDTFPLLTKYVSRKRLSKPWLTSGILKSIKTKAYYFKLVKSGRFSHVRYRIFCNMLDSVLRKSKKEYFNKSFKKFENDPRTTWKLLRNLISTQSKCSIDHIMDGDVPITGSSNISNTFNNFFSNIASNLDRQIPSSIFSPQSFLPFSLNQSIFLGPVNTAEIRSIISNIKNTKSGTESIPPFFVKLTSEYLSPVIAKLINQSYSTGVFPDCLKIAHIIPIHKSGDIFQLNNYRPIAILPFLSKIIEKTFATRLLNFAHKYNLLSTDQFGFLKGKNTSQAILKLVEDIYDSFDDKNNLISVFIDFRKAFDTVNHKILLGKLKSYGIRGLANQFLASYLTDRVQCVHFNSVKSKFNKIEIGVPQGSVLGPVLFLFYINDLSCVSNELSTVLFADDTTLYASGKNFSDLSQIINSEFVKIKNWTYANRLSLNLEKTIVMSFSMNKNLPNPTIYFENNSFTVTNQTKFLGLIIDDQLKFSSHLQLVSLKLSKTVGIIYRVKTYLPRKVLVQLYYSLVYPYLTYCVNIWGSTYDTHLKPIEILQKKILRLITNSSYYAHTTPIFQELNILKLCDIYKFHAALFMFDKIQSSAIAPRHSYSTRFNSDIRPAFHRLTITQHSLSYTAPKIWSNIPISIRNITKLKSFKKNLKQFFIDQYV